VPAAQSAGRHTDRPAVSFVDFVASFLKSVASSVSEIRCLQSARNTFRDTIPRSWTTL
jgi:hypothetical protein